MLIVDVQFKSSYSFVICTLWEGMFVNITMTVSIAN